MKRLYFLKFNLSPVFHVIYIFNLIIKGTGSVDFAPNRSEMQLLILFIG